jgi:hypothetical protein
LWEDERKRFSEVTSKYATDIEGCKAEIAKAAEERARDRDSGALGSSLGVAKKNDPEEQIIQVRSKFFVTLSFCHFVLVK